MYFYKDHKKLFWGLLSGLLITGILGYLIAGDKVIRPDSESQRISQWKAAFYAFKERPLLGYGYLNFEDHSKEIKKRYEIEEQRFTGHAHNNFMEILSTLGMVGFLSFILWLLFWLSEMNKRKSSLNRMSFSFLFVFLVGGSTQSTISLGINLFFILSVFSIIQSDS